MTIYLVNVNDKVSALAYKTLEEAQEFVKNRVNDNDLDGQPPYYSVLSRKDFNKYVITDVMVA